MFSSSRCAIDFSAQSSESQTPAASATSQRPPPCVSKGGMPLPHPQREVGRDGQERVWGEKGRGDGERLRSFPPALQRGDRTEAPKGRTGPLHPSEVTLAGCPPGIWQHSWLEPGNTLPPEKFYFLPRLCLSPTSGRAAEASG